MNRIAFHFIRTFHCLSFLLIFSLSVSINIYAQQRTFPQAPILLEPPNGALVRYPGTQVPIPFSWQDVQGADAYQILVSVDNRQAADFTTNATSAVLNLHLSILESQSTVKWSVRAFSGNQSGSYSDIYTFKFGFVGTPVPGGPILPTPLPVATPSPLLSPKLLSPADKALINSFTVAFDWETVTAAAGYRLTVYQDNEPFIQRNVTLSESVETIVWPNQEVFQWNVLTIGSNGEVSPPGMRYSFTIGMGFLPTPTAVPWDPDINRDGKIDALDLYWFAVSFGTNASLPDFDRSGLTGPQDLLYFLEVYQAGHR
ncbi:MAG: hypothetical protein C4527_03030 [Candidatus Omnitrophota bacterium]|jgi:hypothetical protein|nr:MAG: hypothetical protein C4527_03030 [Candidatus Omnitrophota bacterium]